MPISIYGENNPDLRRFMPDRDATIWRYMDIGKYLDVITKGRLWFNRVIEFRKTDPYEGAITKYDHEKVTSILESKTKEELKSKLQHYGEVGVAKLIDDAPQKSIYWFQLLFIKRIPLVETNVYTSSISCWHENSSESDAMWALYSQREAGIAIKSTVSRVIKSFESSKRTIHIAKVVYDSGERLSALTSGIYDSILIKRQAFTHENEVRIIALTLDGYETPEWTEANQVHKIDPSRPVSPGVYIGCDVNALIEEVVISPLMELYSYQALKAVSKQFLPSTPIRKSTLLTREDIPLGLPVELKLMWNEYLKTGLLPDINEISNSAANSQELSLGERAARS